MITYAPQEAEKEKKDDAPETREEIDKWLKDEKYVSCSNGVKGKKKQKRNH